MDFRNIRFNLNTVISSIDHFSKETITFNDTEPSKKMGETVLQVKQNSSDSSGTVLEGKCFK